MTCSEEQRHFLCNFNHIWIPCFQRTYVFIRISNTYTCTTTHKTTPTEHKHTHTQQIKRDVYLTPHMLQPDECPTMATSCNYHQRLLLKDDMITMYNQINMRTSDNTAYARTSLIAIRKFRNLTHFRGWISETHKFFNEIHETQEYHSIS
jgi:hypothetical protein